MRIYVDEEGEIVLSEVYLGAIIETREGNRLGFCLRDDTVELKVMPKKGVSEWYRVNMQEGTIEPMLRLQRSYSQIEKSVRRGKTPRRWLAP